MVFLLPRLQPGIRLYDRNTKNGGAALFFSWSFLRLFCLFFSFFSFFLFFCFRRKGHKKRKARALIRLQEKGCLNASMVPIWRTHGAHQHIKGLGGSSPACPVPATGTLPRSCYASPSRSCPALRARLPLLLVLLLQRLLVCLRRRLYKHQPFWSAVTRKGQSAYPAPAAHFVVPDITGRFSAVILMSSVANFSMLDVVYARP